ncbi:MAG TPA: MaoC family dehydratase [Steroidobacteraceae bacterium]|nr:MaoC family dehydratase [Steroidobacteraceae bacterium]
MRFRDFVAGAHFQSAHRDVGKDEIIAFARRYDPQPFHVDPAAAAASRWGGLIASGWLTCAVAMELAVTSVLTGSESIGSPGVDELRWQRPVRPGDRLRLSLTVLDSRVASSGETGIVRWHWELHNQRDERVLELTAVSFFDLAAA